MYSGYVEIRVLVLVKEILVPIADQYLQIYIFM